MTSQAEVRRHRLDKKFKGGRIKAEALPAMELASGPNAEASFYNASRWMLPHNRRRFARDQATGRANRYDWQNNQKHREAYSAKIRASLTSAKAKGELADYREFELLQDMFAIPFALTAWQNINLSAEELPLLVFPQARQYFNVRYMGQDGGARQAQWIDERDASQVVMRSISTDKVEYPLWDIQQGSVNKLATIQDNLRFDMEMRIDKIAQDNLDALETDSGLRDVLHLHPLIDPDNIPDKNHLDLSAVNPGVLTIAKWKEILAHINSFGPGIDPTRDIAISSVIMSPQNIRDQWDYIDLVSGFAGGLEVDAATDQVVPSDVRNEIYRTGLLNHAWGYTWSSISNARLPRGRMYVFTNQPVGWFFTKTEMDQLLIWDGVDQAEQNYGQVVWRRVLNFVAPELWKYRIVLVDL